MLTGGRGERLGGVDKSSLVIGGRTLLERVRGALAGATQVIVVGPETEGGPLAAIADGLAQVTSAHVVVLPGDLPFVTAAAVDGLRLRLIEEPGTAAAVAVDEAGRDQLLCAAWDTTVLRAALEAIGDVDGRAVRPLLVEAGRIVRVSTREHPPPWFDCDTPEDVYRARRWAQDGFHDS